MKRSIRLAAEDNVAIAFEEIAPGDLVECGAVELRASSLVPFGHKIALTDIPEGQPVYRYGVPIGFTSSDVPAGAHVHSHNLSTYFLDHQ
jgi:ribosomal protein L2